MNFVAGIIVGAAAGAAVTAVAMYAARGRYVRFLEASAFQLAEQRHALAEHIKELQAELREDRDTADWWKADR